MDTMKDCSNLPVFEGPFKPPLEKRTYTMNKCKFTSDGFPNHLQEGFYKVVMRGKGKIATELKTICKVEKSA